MLGSSVNTVQARTASDDESRPDDDWYTETYPAHGPQPGSLKQSLERQSTASNFKRSSQTSVQLFDGLRVEEYMVDDNQSIDTDSLYSIQLFDGRRVEEFMVNDSGSPTYPCAPATAYKTCDDDSAFPEAQEQSARLDPPSKLDVVYPALTRPPFLTWPWLVSSSDTSMPAHRLAAENLFTIMQDIERHLLQRSDGSYMHATECTFEDMKAKVDIFQHHRRNVPNKYDFSYSSFGLASGFGAGDSMSPLKKQSVANLLSEDAILQSQTDAIYTAMGDLSTIAQRFMGLFIPRSFPHAVSRKIWGSLLMLLKVCQGARNIDPHIPMRSSTSVLPQLFRLPWCQDTVHEPRFGAALYACPMFVC
jgi:hypothetical protein